MRNVSLEFEAQHLRTTAEELGKLLEDKCRAYGGAHNRQVDIWAAVLKQYEEERDGVAGYWIPDALIYHMPRLTRIFDRVMRIVANPINDHGGEDPWRDMAGDALAGCVMPKPHVAGRNCPEPRCERTEGHEGMHASMDAAGIHRWHPDPPVPMDAQGRPRGYDPQLDSMGEVADECGAWFPAMIGDRQCVKPKGHTGRHVCARGLADERSAEFLTKAGEPS